MQMLEGNTSKSHQLKYSIQTENSSSVSTYCLGSFLLCRYYCNLYIYDLNWERSEEEFPQVDTGMRSQLKKQESKNKLQ